MFLNCTLLYAFVLACGKRCWVQFWREEQYILSHLKSSRQAVNFRICIYSEKLLGMATMGSFPKIKLPIVSFYIIRQF